MNIILLLSLLFFQFQEQKKYDIHIIVDENKYSNNHLSDIVQIALREPFNENWNQAQINFIKNYRSKINFVANIIWHSDEEVTSDVELPAYCFSLSDKPRNFGDFAGGYKVTCCAFDFIMHFNYIVQLNAAINGFDEWRAHASNSWSKTPKFSILVPKEVFSNRKINISRNKQHPRYRSNYDEMVLVPLPSLGCYPDPYFRSERLIIYELDRRIYRADGRIIAETRRSEEFIPGDDVLDMLRDMDMNTGILVDYIRLIEEGDINLPTLNKYRNRIDDNIYE